ncbi:MAG: DNA repair protein RadC [Elusimicrobia bacterium]|nr:DNA repair protein RadC [Elusimicrobiota bacterium]
MMSLKDLHPVERPRERLERLNPEALAEPELLALVLRTGYGGHGVLELAQSLLKAYPQGLAQAGYQSLKRFKGVGPSRAASLVAGLELGRRQARGSPQDTRPVLDTPAGVLAQVPSFVKSARKEHFLAFYLNARHQLLHSEIVSVGTLSASLVHPREIFAPAVAHAAAALIVVHNHPSGDCSPSLEDKDATRRLARCGELMGIPLLDHLVVSGSGCFSFRDNGDLKAA